MAKSKQKKKKTPQDWHEQNLKKLNYLKSLGFRLGLAEWNGTEWEYSTHDYYSAAILDNMENENQYSAYIGTPNDVICLHLSRLAYKLLNFNTFSIELDNELFCCLFHYDEFTYKNIDEMFSKINIKGLNQRFFYNFTKSTMPKINMPKDKAYNLNSLPYMEISQFKKLKDICKMLNDNKGVQFQINQGRKYRIPKIILDLLSSPYLNLNDKKILEKVLLTITNSTFAITRSTSTPYRNRFKDFSKGLKLSRGNETQEALIKACFDNLRKYNLIDTYEIDDTGMLTFYATALSEKIKAQNTQREIGFYDKVPGTRQSRVISAWLDYLYMINSFTRQNKTLQISLDSLLSKLHLNHLLQKHRLKDISKLLNTMLEVSNIYGLTQGECNFDSDVIRELLKDRQGLKKYIKLVEKKTEESKKNG